MSTDLTAAGGEARDSAGTKAPRRVQLLRTKGWRLPPTTVSVARPGLWGNPFYVSRWRDAPTCVALFANSVRGIWDPAVSEHLPVAWRGYDDHCRWLDRWRANVGCLPIERIGDLAGKNLACWCAADAACHADVLLQLANALTSMDGCRHG